MNIWKLFKNLIYLQRLSVMIDGKGYQMEILTIVILSLNQSMKAMKNLGRGCLKHLSQIIELKTSPSYYYPQRWCRNRVTRRLRLSLRLSINASSSLECPCSGTTS